MLGCSSQPRFRLDLRFIYSRTFVAYPDSAECDPEHGLAEKVFGIMLFSRHNMTKLRIAA